MYASIQKRKFSHVLKQEEYQYYEMKYKFGKYLNALSNLTSFHMTIKK